MATVEIERTWPDGDELVVRIHVDDSFPDVVREGVKAALDAYRDAMGITMAEGDE